MSRHSDSANIFKNQPLRHLWYGVKLIVSQSDETDNNTFLCTVRDNEGIFYHCYQRPKDRGVIFYTVSDHLLYFTIMCIRSVQYKVKILKCVQMPDHTHHSVIEYENGHLSAFIQDVTSTFTREYNAVHGRKGPMFKTPFGRAVKKTSKSIRTNLTYLDNNPVERQLVSVAEDYRWNYLAYAVSCHPFSPKIVLRKASMPLRRALKIVKDRHSKGRYLTGALLRRLFDSLPCKLEREQLTDYIISTYSVIDHKAAISHFKSYENELITAHANTGSEYDIKEQFIGRSDACYVKMTRALLASGLVKDIREIFSIPPEQKRKAFRYINVRVDAPGKQIAAFLHIPQKQV